MADPDYYDLEADQFVYPDGTRVNAEDDPHNPAVFHPALDHYQQAALVHIADQIGAMTRELMHLPPRTNDPRDDPK